jgi:putative transposase
MAGVNSDEWIGIFARVGTDLQVPERGGNPQGHGAVERSNQSIWIRAAKELPTYTGKDMDRCVRKKIYVRLEKDLKQAKNDGKLGMTARTSELLLTPEEFTAYLLEWAIEYNNTPHSALPKITDPATNRRRHMTPFEALAERVAEGWQPTAPPAEMLPYLFMPHERIKVRRNLFTLRGNKYHAYELGNYHLRDDLIAAFDIHNAERVWVMDADERFICEAKWNGNRISAVPVTVEQQAIMDREARRTKNLENKLELIRGEADQALEAPAHIELPQEVIEGEQRRAVESEIKQACLESAQRYKEMSSPVDIYYMLRQRVEAGTATEYQRSWKQAYEIFQDKGRKLPPLKDDPYCLEDPDEDRLARQAEE